MKKKPDASTQQENVKRNDASSTPTPFGPRSMEKMMRDLSRLLEQQDFDSIEEANAFLQQVTGQPIPEMPPEDDALFQAEEIVYQAYEAPTRKEAIRLAREALKVSLDCADAYVLLAEVEARTEKAACRYYEQAVAAAERALGPVVFEEDKGHFWGILETRPYMRARRGLAETLWLLDEEEAAIEHYRDLLRLNPNDNQGIRYLLADCLLETEQDEALKALIDQYEEDTSANWLYNRALLLFRNAGDDDDARAALTAALDHNPHVPKYLLGKKKLPEVMPPYIGFGDENEAIDYALSGITHWRNTYGAVRWLRTHASGLR